MQIVAPAISGSQISEPDASKLKAVRASTTSDASTSHWPACHSMWFETPRCGTTTPLGSPVEPDV